MKAISTLDVLCFTVVCGLRWIKQLLQMSKSHSMNTSTKNVRNSSFMYLSASYPVVVCDICFPLNEDPNTDRYVQWFACQTDSKTPRLYKESNTKLLLWAFFNLSTNHPYLLFPCHKLKEEGQTMIWIKAACRYVSTHTKQHSSGFVYKSLVHNAICDNYSSLVPIRFQYDIDLLMHERCLRRVPSKM